jgi:hypothetical protein
MNPGHLLTFCTSKLATTFPSHAQTLFAGSLDKQTGRPKSCMGLQYLKAVRNKVARACLSRIQPITAAGPVA